MVERPSTLLDDWSDVAMPDRLYALSAWRERRGLSVADLAARADLTVRTLRLLERGGVPTHRTARRLADALEVQPHVLTHAAERDPAACVVCRHLSAMEAHPDADEELLIVRGLAGGDLDVPLPGGVEKRLFPQVTASRPGSA